MPLTAITRQPLPVRWHLVSLVLVAILPLAVFAAVVVHRDLQEQRNILAKGMFDTARALSLAIDGEVRASRSILDTLAASAHLDTGDLKAFYDLCATVMAGRRDAYIVLFDPSGQQLMNTSRPFGSPLPNPVLGVRPPGADPRYPDLPVGGAVAVQRALETRRPVISDLFISLVTKQPRISLDLPVVRGDRVRYVLELSFDAQVFTDMLLDRHLPTDAVMSILDSNAVVVARNLNASERVGRRPSPTLEQIATSNEAIGVGHTVEGLPVYHVFTRSPDTGWTTSLAISQTVVSRPFTRWLLLLGGGATVALIIGVVAAFALGKRISGSLSTLASAAEAMARGDRVEIQASALREVGDLHRALVTASAAVREAAGEHEQRLVSDAKQEEAQAANRAKDEFLAVLSHELRTPLATMVGWIRMLQQAPLDSAQRQRALEAVERSTRSLARMIDDLLDISRIVARRMTVERVPTSLVPLVVETVDAFQPEAKAKGIMLQTRVEPDPGIVLADSQRLRQVLSNLLANAVRHTPADGRVEVSLATTETAIRIRVQDTGSGIEPDELPHVFERLRQTDLKRGSVHGSLGLGLAIVKNIVELHEGTVEAQSDGPGRGATFTVTLPLLRQVRHTESTASD